MGTYTNISSYIKMIKLFETIGYTKVPLAFGKETKMGYFMQFYGVLIFAHHTRSNLNEFNAMLITK